MTVTKDYQKNPAKDAIKVVDAMGYGPAKFKRILLETASHYNGDTPHLYLAIKAIATSRGLDPEAVSKDITTILQEGESERASLGKKLLVNGKESGSAVEQNDRESYEAFLEEYTGKLGMAQSNSKGITEVYSDTDSEGNLRTMSVEDAESIREGLRDGKFSSWLTGF